LNHLAQYEQRRLIVLDYQYRSRLARWRLILRSHILTEPSRTNSERQERFPVLMRRKNTLRASGKVRFEQAELKPGEIFIRAGISPTLAAPDVTTDLLAIRVKTADILSTNKLSSFFRWRAHNPGFYR
jgi:hypothetical protein